jgi:hypothetical protein
MDAQDFRSLQEAYLGVYQDLDEEQDATPPKGQSKYDRKAPAGYMNTRKSTLQQMSSREKKAWNDRGIGEEVDIYDIILSHLLDEGYAETIESAQAIMVNMSEEWRESIVDEMLGEGWKTELAKRALKKVGKEVRNSDAYKKAKRFAVTTALGAIGVPLIS